MDAPLMVKGLINQRRKAVFGPILFIMLFLGVIGCSTVNSRQSPACPTPTSTAARSSVETTLHIPNAQELLISRVSEKTGTSIELWDIQGTAPKATFVLDPRHPVAAYAPDGKAILYSEGGALGNGDFGLYSLDLSSGQT